jgi:hypothetical protein
VTHGEGLAVERVSGELQEIVPLLEGDLLDLTLVELDD